MYIESLELKNFRNYKNLSLEFDHGTNVFYGHNAQGKTNILEAMNLCGTSRSHRGSKDGEMILFDRDEAHIRMYLQKNGMRRKIDMHLRKNRTKGVAIDGLPIRRAAELLELAKIVFFSPEDLNIVKNGPKERRKFLDAIASSMDPGYLRQLSSYNKILAQRNRLLKDMHLNYSLRDTLDVWDEQLVSSGKKIIEDREKLIARLNAVIRDIHLQLTGGTEVINIVYEKNVDKSDFGVKIRESREKDERFKTTSAGPHRDDLKIIVNDIDIRHFGSQGQQRSAALSLKLSEISLMKETTGDIPILMLDDVLSELDENRQNYLLRSIGNVQTFITCTGMEDLLEKKFEIDKIFRVDDGKVNVEEIRSEEENE